MNELVQITKNTQKQVNKKKSEMKKLKLGSKVHEQKMEKMEETITEMRQQNLELESSVKKLELEKAQYLIRIQKFLEQKEEKVKDRIQEWLMEQNGRIYERHREDLGEISQVMEHPRNRSPSPGKDSSSPRRELTESRTEEESEDDSEKEEEGAAAPKFKDSKRQEN
ncbi:uncharacterized protein [Tiliqua scincoides]|uniref:uncharacterized protein n=1 Tax=Tiliqua scincoides TaxID=71010 RepID=UPI0034637B59